MTRILTALVATIFIAFAAPVAEAAPKTTFTIRGAGWGHGVGMSQYGAMGYARNGWNAAQILGHYYSGTALGTTDPNKRVRVLLVAGHALGADQRRPPGRLAQARPDGDLHAQAARAVAGRPLRRAGSGWPRSPRRSRSRATAA